MPLVMLWRIRNPLFSRRTTPLLEEGEVEKTARLSTKFATR
ncbi:UNVERIFIED_CONTAM: hypothetical protein NCL1_58905 [Trichonephila clavipes]